VVLSMLSLAAALAGPSFGVGDVRIGDEVLDAPWSSCSRDEGGWWCPSKVAGVEVVYRLHLDEDHRLVRYVVRPSELDDVDEAAIGCELLLGGTRAALGRPDYRFPIDELARSEVTLWRRGAVDVVTLQKEAPTGCWVNVQGAMHAAPSGAEQAVGEALFGAVEPAAEVVAPGEE